MQRNSVLVGPLDEEAWVTVYGFLPVDTNLVLREFKKRGIILKHVPGPRDANWMNILYQVFLLEIDSKDFMLDDVFSHPWNAMYQSVSLNCIPNTITNLV